MSNNFIGFPKLTSFTYSKQSKPVANTSKKLIMSVPLKIIDSISDYLAKN